MSLKLIGPSQNGRVVKILIAAKYAGVTLERDEFWPKSATPAEKQEFTKINPNGKIPVLVTEEGNLFESNTILRYIARISKQAKLYGNNTYEEALVDQQLDWFISYFEPVYLHVALPITGNRSYNQGVYDKALDAVKEMLKQIEETLKTTQYLIGTTFTLADIYLAQYCQFLFRYALDEKGRKPYPNLVKYYNNLANEANFKDVLGRPFLTKTALKPYVSAEEKEAAAQAAAAKKKKGGKEETKKEEEKAPAAKAEKTEKKPAEKKPAEKKEKAPAAKAEKKEAPKMEAKPAADDDDELKEKKVLNPLDSLPPSSFNLFDFKTLFVNHPDKKEALRIFWEQLDDQGYSVWRMEYEKAEGEGRVGFLTSNLLGGFLQRLETFRKYSFGVVGVYGDEPNLEVRGCWVWRGTEIPFEIKDHPSGEWYKFRKLDVKNNEADRKIQEEYWTKWEEDVDQVEGLTCRDIKYFK